MTATNNNDIYMVVPYTKWLSETLKKICSKHGIQVLFKGGNIMKNLMLAPKDKDTLTEKGGVIYKYKCQGVECNEEYIGESARPF